jgi:cysteine desulfurase
MKKIYLDHSATTPLDSRVLDAMMPFLTQEFGNPSSLHGFGRPAKVALEAARETIAKTLGCSPGEIYFTSGGSEADNLAIRGIAEALSDKGKHIITNHLEHHAVLHTMDYLAQQGFEISYAKSDSFGMIHPEVIRELIRPDTILISVMHVNNEVGTVNPIAEIGRMARERHILFHTDAVQSYGKLPIHAGEFNIDLMSMSAHKLYGPKGAGALYIRRGIKPIPILYGGSQERGQRAGTENLAGIVGFAKAAELCHEVMETESQRLTQLRQRLWEEISSTISGCHLNGHPDKRLPGHLNVSIEGVMGDEMLIHLDLAGIAVSTGSACTSGSVSTSHVLNAMGIDATIARGAVRMTMGRSTQSDDIPLIVEAVRSSVEKARAAK